MAKIPNFVPGDKAHLYKEAVTAKRKNFVRKAADAVPAPAPKPKPVLKPKGE
jgi:hypothetical protein